MNSYQNIFRAKPSNYRLVNYEYEVYKLIYGSEPLTPLTLNYKRPKKEHEGLYWDNMIDESIISKLNKINKIEIVDINQGKDAKLLMHIIFRPINQDPEYIQHVVDRLNNGPTKAKYGVGIGNRLIIYVATRNWYRPDSNNDSFNKWWQEIPNKIEVAVK